MARAQNPFQLEPGLSRGARLRARAAVGPAGVLAAHRPGRARFSVRAVRCAVQGTFQICVGTKPRYKAIGGDSGVPVRAYTRPVLIPGWSGPAGWQVMLAHHKPGRTDYRLDEVAGRFAARSPRVTVGAEGGTRSMSRLSPVQPVAACPGGAGTHSGGCRTQELTPSRIPHDVYSAVHPLAAAAPFFRVIDLPVLGGWRGTGLVPPWRPGTIAGSMYPCVTKAGLYRYRGSRRKRLRGEAG
jgi:hypothetical protein